MGGLSMGGLSMGGLYMGMRYTLLLCVGNLYVVSARVFMLVCLNTFIGPLRNRSMGHDGRDGWHS